MLMAKLSVCSETLATIYDIWPRSSNIYAKFEPP